MTEPMIKLPSVIIKELQAELADKDAKLEDKNAELADKDAEIHRLKELLNQPSPDNKL